MIDVVISQDFFPQVGGAHSWLYEVYKRWPTPVALLTRQSQTGPAAAAAAEFDAAAHGSLSILRNARGIDDINILDSHFRAQLRATVRELILLRQGKRAVLHCLRAFPEGVIALAHKLRAPRSRLVVYAHGEEILVAGSSRQLLWLTKAVYRCADLVIANSHNTESLVKAL